MPLYRDRGGVAAKHLKHPNVVLFRNSFIVSDGSVMGIKELEFDHSFYSSSGFIERRRRVSFFMRYFILQLFFSVFFFYNLLVCYH